MQASRSTVIPTVLAASLLLGTTAGAAGQSPGLSADPSQPPSEPPGVGETPAAGHTLDELVAPVVGSPPTVEEFQLTYPVQFSNVHEVVRLKKNFDRDKTIRTIIVPDYSTIGNAAALCDQASFGGTPKLAALERQAACYMAIRLAWFKYLERRDSITAEDDFGRARLAFRVASHRLSDGALEWLTNALKSGLPATAGDMPGPLPEEGLKPDANSKGLVRSPGRRVKAERILRLVREALVADTVSSPADWESLTSDLAGHPGPVSATGEVIQVGLVSSCLRNMWTLMGKLPENQYGEGIAPGLPPFNACWDLTATLWRAYKRTGVREYRDAAFAAWQSYRHRFPEVKPGSRAFEGQNQWNPIR